jgi:hypothetical protein
MSKKDVVRNTAFDKLNEYFYSLRTYAHSTNSSLRDANALVEGDAPEGTLGGSINEAFWRFLPKSCC